MVGQINILNKLFYFNLFSVDVQIVYIWKDVGSLCVQCVTKESMVSKSSWNIFLEGKLSIVLAPKTSNRRYSHVIHCDSMSYPAAEVARDF
jgi:hypothetical protein